jgi:hypothetical protein
MPRLLSRKAAQPSAHTLTAAPKGVGTRAKQELAAAKRRRAQSHSRLWRESDHRDIVQVAARRMRSGGECRKVASDSLEVTQ